MVGSATEHNSVDRIACCNRCGERLEQQRGRTFTTTLTVGCAVKRVTAIARRKHAQCPQRLRFTIAQQQAGGAHQSHLTFTRAQSAQRSMHRHQAGRTGGGDYLAGSRQIKGMGDAIRTHGMDPANRLQWIGHIAGSAGGEAIGIKCGERHQALAPARLSGGRPASNKQ